MKRSLGLPVLVVACILLITPLRVGAQAFEEWVGRYNGPGGIVDAPARDIATDASGNVYVTGQSWGGATLEDYATVKYGPDGAELWVRRYNGLGGSGDTATAIAVDASGNVLVTGRSYGGGLTHDDFATIKYAPDGTQLWVARYNGPAMSDDQATALCVDGAGNVYVTGISDSGGYSFDVATVKYGPDGTQLWASRYDTPSHGMDHPQGMALDSAGGTVVVGLSHVKTTTPDFFTIKYDPSGAALWSRIYDGGTGSADNARSVAVDASDNIVVTGTGWPSLGDADYATVKYAADGTELWVRKYDAGGGSLDEAFAVAVDGAGNAYVTGASGTTAEGSDFATVKYAPDGTELWVARYDRAAAGDGAAALALDGYGNVYVAGTTNCYGSPTRCDASTVKYSPDGTERWAMHYDGPAGDSDTALALAVDADRNVVVSARSKGIGTSDDYAAVKYSQGLPPSAVSGGPYQAECSGRPAVIRLDGTASSDPEGGSLTWSWTTDCPGASFDDAASATPVLSLDGPSSCRVSCTVTVTVTDPVGNTGVDATALSVEDTTAPSVLESRDDLGCIWPPNHRYVCFDASDFSPVAADACSGVASWHFAGCGSSAGCVVSPDQMSFCVRAERAGDEPDGRRYAVAVAAEDGCGNVSAPAVIGYVHVPHDQGAERGCR